MFPESKWPIFDKLQWERDVSGYVRTPGNRIEASGGPVERYDPAEKCDYMHRRFLKLELGDNDALLAFINEYGLLGVDGNPAPKTETLAQIWLAHTNMWIYVEHAHDDKTASPEERNRHFNQWCPQHMSVVMDTVGFQTILKVSPRTLLAWMWLRLAQENAGAIELRPCARPDCPNAFYVGKVNGQHTDRREYCSDNCRNAHNYGIRTGRYARKAGKGQPVESHGVDASDAVLTKMGLIPNPDIPPDPAKRRKRSK